MARQDLFRAVEAAELADITAQGRFMNPYGIERKFFATTLEGAKRFTRMATETFLLGPFAIVRTSIDLSLIRPDNRANVDRGTETVVLPSNLLPFCEPPQLLDTEL